MLDREQVERAVGLQARGYRLLRWLEKAFVDGFITPEAAGTYATTVDAAYGWLEKHYRNLPDNVRPEPSDLRAFSNLFSTYVDNTFDLDANPGRFVLAPILLSVGYSLTNYNPFNPPTRYVGPRNYRLLFTDTEFLTALWVTTILTLIVVIVPNVLGLAIAVLLDRRGWLYNALRSVFFTPMVLSSVVVSIIWTRLLAADGPLNRFLALLGVRHPPGWLSDPDYALYSVASVISWQMLGFCVVVYLAGLQGVPTELYEAAALDGAGALRRFRHVSWPLLAPALTINTVVLLISAFKAFDHIQVITNGGPGEGTTATIAFTVLNTAFTANRQGYAAAEAVVMLVIIAVATAVALRVLRRREVSL